LTGSITTATVNSFKQQLMMACHCFMTTNTQTGNTINSNNLINQLTATGNLVVGMAVSGTDVPSNTFIAYIVNSTAIVMSNNATGATQTSITFTGDVFKMALIKAGETGTYNNAITNYNQLTGNSDEVSGTNYTAGGYTLTNVTPTVPDSNTAITTFSVNPTWTTATIAANGAMIYNATTIARFGNGYSNNTVSNHDFGGEQQVTAGTFTVSLPAANGTVGLLRIA
jgi:hypothetical protein